MARKVRPVHCWGIVKRDYIEIKGLGDCRVMSEPRYSCESLDIIQFWVMTPTYKPLLLAMSEESYLNVVEFIDDNDEEFTEEIERVMMCELHKGEKFYFGRRKVKLVERTSFMHFLLQPETSHRQFDMKLMPTMIVKRVMKIRKTKPLSFTEFALSSYEKALSKLAKAVMGLQMDPARVEVQKPAKKAAPKKAAKKDEDVEAKADEGCALPCPCRALQRGLRPLVLPGLDGVESRARSRADLFRRHRRARRGSTA